jgi:hypothetical protein
VTIYDEDTCIGEAMLDSIRPGDDKFLPYGVDKTVVIEATDGETTLPVHKTSIRGRYFTRTHWRIYERTYRFDHKGSTHIASMFIEHRFRKGDEFELWDTKEPVSKTENFLRFELRVNAGEVTVFKVKERKLEHDSRDLSYVGRDEVKGYFESKHITQGARDSLVNDIIPHREAVEKQRSVVSNANNNFNNTLNQQNSSQSSIASRVQYNNSSSSNSLWHGNEVAEDIVAWAQHIVDQEPYVRRYRATVREEQATLTREETAYNLRFSKLIDDVTIR